MPLMNVYSHLCLHCPCQISRVMQEADEEEMKMPQLRPLRQKLEDREEELWREAQLGGSAAVMSWMGQIGRDSAGKAQPVKEKKPKGPWDHLLPEAKRAERRKAMKAKWQNNVMDCKITEVIFRVPGALGLNLEPFCVTFETLPGMLQSFWCGIVTRSPPDEKVGLHHGITSFI